TFSHSDQIGSINTLTSCVCTRNEACPIHVMQSWTSPIFGKNGRAWLPARFVKSVGIRTSVRKLRFRQSLPGRSRTRVEPRFCGVPAPSPLVWRTTFLRLFFGKRIGTWSERYGLTESKAKCFGNARIKARGQKSAVRDQRTEANAGSHGLSRAQSNGIDNSRASNHSRFRRT